MNWLLCFQGALEARLWVAEAQSFIRTWFSPHSVGSGGKHSPHRSLLYKLKHSTWIICYTPSSGLALLLSPFHPRSDVMLIQEQIGEFGSAKVAGRKLHGVHYSIFSLMNMLSRSVVVLRKLDVSGLQRLWGFFLCRSDDYVIISMHVCTQYTHIACPRRLYCHIASVVFCRWHCALAVHKHTQMLVSDISTQHLFIFLHVKDPAQMASSEEYCTCLYIASQ